MHRCKSVGRNSQHSVLRFVACAPTPSRQRKENAGKRELSFALFVVFVSCSSLERVLRERPVDIPLTQDARPERAMLAVPSRVRSMSPQAETRPSTAGAGPAVQSGKALTSPKASDQRRAPS